MKRGSGKAENEAVVVAVVDAEHLEPATVLIGMGENDGGHGWLLL